LPLLERARVEVYIPERSETYSHLLTSLKNEFTFSFGGCTVVTGLIGSYSSKSGYRIPDRINLIYTDLPFALSNDFVLLSRYTRRLHEAVVAALSEEAVLVTASPIYHVV
jgi:hypothetical protein